MAVHGKHRGSTEPETRPFRNGVVPDVIAPRLDVIFVGINPDPLSGESAHHFASRRNAFWKLLHESGFVRNPWGPSEEAKLLEVGIGITNLVARVTRSSSDLTRIDLERGRRALERKVEQWRPRAVIFLGLTAWRAMRRGQRRGDVPNSHALCGSRWFVLPNPSGRNAGYSYARMLREWRVVAADVRRGATRTRRKRKRQAIGRNEETRA